MHARELKHASALLTLIEEQDKVKADLEKARSQKKRKASNKKRAAPNKKRATTKRSGSSNKSHQSRKRSPPKSRAPSKSTGKRAKKQLEVMSHCSCINFSRVLCASHGAFH